MTPLEELKESLVSLTQAVTQPSPGAGKTRDTLILDALNGLVKVVENQQEIINSVQRDKRLS